MIQGYYYLHENKELIYKPGSDSIIDIRESNLCHSAWAWDEERFTAWGILVEALSLGANKKRIKELAKRWKCDNKDAQNYAEYLGFEIEMDGDSYNAKRKDFVNLMESPCGFGDSYLEAMASLCKQLGFKGGKMWNVTFEGLLRGSNSKWVNRQKGYFKALQRTIS